MRGTMTRRVIYGGPPWNRKVVGFECRQCDGIGRVNHRCGMGACVDDPCPACAGTGIVRSTESASAQTKGE